MLKLYQREGCPYCASVRTMLTELGIEFDAVSVPKLASERHQVMQLAGVDKPEIPVLVDGERVIQGSDAIKRYLMEETPHSWFGDPSYGLTRRFENVSFPTVVEATTIALGGEGFGVLTSIDVKATMRKKLDVEFRPYVILGACNPPLAHQALTGEPGIGLLLPCNVVVTEESDSSVVVSAIDPVRMFSVVGHPELEPVAKEVSGRLKRVLAAVDPSALSEVA